MSPHTQRAYRLDVRQFMTFSGHPAGHYEELLRTLPGHVTAWRDSLTQAGMADMSVTRKVTALRSLFTYLTNYGFKGANPAHPDFVKTPAHPREGKTVGLGPRDCRKLLDAPPGRHPRRAPRPGPARRPRLLRLPRRGADQNQGREPQDRRRAPHRRAPGQGQEATQGGPAPRGPRTARRLARRGRYPRGPGGALVPARPDAPRSWGGMGSSGSRSPPGPSSTWSSDM